MAMFNTAAIRVQPLQGASRAEFVRDATSLATRLGVSVVFCWGTVWEFWFHANSNVDQNLKDLQALIDQELRSYRGDTQLERTVALNTLKDLNNSDD